MSNKKTPKKSINPLVEVKDKKEEDEKEKATAARRALCQAVAKLPTKPIEKLPMEYLRTLPMVIGVGSFLVLFALISYVPSVEKSFFGTINHISKKTNELIDYTSLSASVGVSSLVEEISSIRRIEKKKTINSDNVSYLNIKRYRLANIKKNKFNSFSFSETTHLIINSAMSIYSLDNLKKIKVDEEIITENNDVEKDKKEEGSITVYNIESDEYYCSKIINGEATTTPGGC